MCHRYDNEAQAAHSVFLPMFALSECKPYKVTFTACMCKLLRVLNIMMRNYSGLNLNQDKATKPQTVQIVRQGEATPYWFKVNPLYFAKMFF